MVDRSVSILTCLGRESLSPYLHGRGINQHVARLSRPNPQGNHHPQPHLKGPKHFYSLTVVNKNLQYSLSIEPLNDIN